MTLAKATAAGSGARAAECEMPTGCAAATRCGPQQEQAQNLCSKSRRQRRRTLAAGPIAPRRTPSP
eukprot:8982063-Pyramimonas_sp.AAC.1